MGSSFFKSSAPKIGPAAIRVDRGNAFTTRAAAGAAQKDLGAAMGISKSKFKPQKTNSAYAKGPKT